MTATPLAPISRAACIGGGVIGGGWVARFLLAGIDVKVFDPHPEAQRIVGEVIANAERAYGLLTNAPLPPRGRLTFCASLREAVTDAEWIQESVPERLDLSHPERARHNPFERTLVSGVVHAPGGAHPTSCAPRYGWDLDELKRYTASAGEEGGWERYRAEVIGGSEAEYLERVGGLDRVTALPVAAI